MIEFGQRNRRVLSRSVSGAETMSDHADPANAFDFQRHRPPEEYSVYSDSYREIDLFKWIESEKAGRDLGEVAIRDWVRRHWSGFLRARWLEHLQGVRYWTELDKNDFGILRRDFADRQEMLDDILDRLKTGCENLDVLLWAREKKYPIESVLEILEMLDINSRRLAHHFDEYDCRRNTR
jgi:hypothetical protein